MEPSVAINELNSVLRWCLSILLMAVQSGSCYLVEVDFLRAKYDDVIGHLLVDECA